MEIEHKFLVISDEYENLAIKSYKITQGYLSRNVDSTIRIRIRDDKGFLTIKGKTITDSRPEFEYEIPLKDAKEMLALCAGKVVRKTRFIVPYKGYIWEVDRFDGELAPLVVAEIELPYSHNDYPLPPFVGENVTGNPKYYNSNL